MARQVKLCLVLSVIPLLSVVAFGDEIELRDGTTLQGKVVSQSQTEIRFEVSGDIKSIPLENVARLALGGPTGKAGSIDLISLDASGYPVALAKAKSDHKNKNECVKDCEDEKVGDLTWDVACSDYCTCLWETDNTKEQCQKEFKDTVGEDPPFSLPPPEDPCGLCSLVISSVKACVDKDALGPGEDLRVTVPCSQSTPSYWRCNGCFDALSLQKTCCSRGGACWTEPCTLFLGGPYALR